MTITIETGETGKAFGSITAKDIADQLKAELGGIEIERHKIVLERPIKDTGDHEISIKLHHDVSATLNLHVKAKAEAVAKKEEETAEKPFKAKPKARHTK